MLATLGLLLPAAILFVLQYRSLSQLQAQTENATREMLRQSLSAISIGVERSLEKYGDEVFACLEDVDLSDPKAVAAHFVVSKNAHPEVSQVFFESEENHYAVVVPADGTPRVIPVNAPPSALQPVVVIHHAHYMSRTGKGGVPNENDYSFLQESPRSDLYVFKTLQVGVADKATLEFVGFTIPADQLLRAFLAPAIADLQAPPPAVGQECGLAVAVLSGEGEVIARFPEGKAQHYEQTWPFGATLPSWSLGAGFVGTTAAQLARTQFLQNLAATSIVLVLLVLGIVLTVRATAREAKLSQLKSSFVSNVSHEMKTPLALIRLFAETLELGRVTGREKIQEYYRVIHRESRKLAALVENVLDFSRMEAGRKQYQFAEGSAGDVVRTVVRDYDDHITTAGFDLTVAVESGLPDVRMDAAALSQAILNLLDNAVKYSKDVKRIGVAAHRSGNELAIDVSDAGIGIPKSEQGRIFEKFYRIDTGLVRDTQGSGLGLALTRHIVEAHGGRIVVDSTPGRGSRFTILLPIETGDERPEARNDRRTTNDEVANGEAVGA